LEDELHVTMDENDVVLSKTKKLLAGNKYALDFFSMLLFLILNFFLM
jgi:hypothetical protein